MHTVCPDRESFNQTLKEADNDSFNFIVVVTAALDPGNAGRLKTELDECVRVLKNGGVLFVQGRPEYLPELGVHLDRRLNFKYWIAIESQLQRRKMGLPSVHAAVLLFTKGNGRFNIKRTRFPHQHCAFCKRTLKDWGGKSHLMHPDGYVISDVWKDLPEADNYVQLSRPVLEAILRMLDFESSAASVEINYERADLFQQLDVPVTAGDVKGLIGPKEGIAAGGIVAEPVAQYRLPGFTAPPREYSDVTNEIGGKLFNVVHHGDAVKILEQYPDNSIDLVFADPPYNLDKAYHVYDDERADEEYVK